MVASSTPGNAGRHRPDADELRALTRGQWPSILAALGADPALLDGKPGHPCPACGGTDRFHFTDRNGDGSFVCRGCGGGNDGFSMAGKLLELDPKRDFPAILERVAELCGGMELGEPRERQGARTPSQDKGAVAAEKAHRIWNAAKPARVDHPYQTRKGVSPTETVRESSVEDVTRILGYHPKGRDGPLEGRILVAPVELIDGTVSTLELIDESGRKSSVSGGVKKGGFWRAQLLPGGDGTGATILLAEGVATAISARLATGFYAVAALSCTNLENVAKALSERFPKARRIILADLGPGEESARKAAAATGALLVVPNFGPDRQEVATDFNDLAQLKGLDAVRVAIEAAAPVAAAPDRAQARGITLAALLQREFPEPRWAVPGILPEGVALLGGKPKIGKSWLALSFALAIACGGRVMGQIPVQKGEVLYLALEDNFRRLQSRCRKLLETESAPAPEGLHLFTEWKRLDQGGVEDLDQWLVQHPKCRLVIIDTLAKIRPGRSRNGDVYAEDYAVGAALKPVADRHGVAVLVVHHLRKMTSDDPLEMLSGTMGLSGGMDGILVMQRPRGKDAVTLFVTGRDIPEEKTHALKWHQDTGAWELLGDVSTITATEEQQAILDAIRGQAGHGLTIQEITEAVGKSNESTRKIVGRMVTAGTLQKSGPRNSTRYSIKSSQPARGEGSVSISQPSQPSYVSQPSQPSQPINGDGGVGMVGMSLYGLASQHDEDMNCYISEGYKDIGMVGTVGIDSCPVQNCEDF